MRVLLLTGSGSGLLSLLALRPWWSRFDAAWVAVAAADTSSALAGMPVTWVPASAGVIRALATLLRNRPSLVVSADGRLARPFFLVARVLRVPSLWIGPPSARAARLARASYSAELY